MQRFSPPNIPSDLPQPQQRYFREMHRSIAQAALAGNDFVALRTLSADLPKYQDGIYKLSASHPSASGGAGFYGYDSATATFTKF